MPIVTPDILSLNNTLPHVPQAPNKGISDEPLQFNFPGSDIVLRSRDAHNFPLPKFNIVISSPVLRNLIESVLNTSGVPSGEQQREPLPVVELPESKETLYSLFTFIFPITPVFPSSAERIMELLAVAQKYEINSAVSHIRGIVARQDPPFIRPETAFHVYFLAQQHDLRQEAVQAARLTLRFSMALESLGDKLDFPGLTGTYLHELWKYHEQVRTELKSVVLEFINSGLLDNVKNLRCGTPGNSSSPQWLYDHINTMAGSPHLFDLTSFQNAWDHHLESQTTSNRTCSCANIPIVVLLSFWDAFTFVVHKTIDKEDFTLTLVKEEPASENSDPSPVPRCLDMPKASIIVRSSDQVNFRIHKPVLAMSSPFFKDLLSLPQPSDGELVDGLPVVAFPENTDLLKSLISLLYPISLVIPDSYQKVLALLAVCQKYEMESVQFIICALIKAGTYPALLKHESFSAYAIASSLGLDQEAEEAACLNLGQPMTFESLGEGLRLFKGREQFDLIRYRSKNQLEASS